MTSPLRLGTRCSPLALWQANYVANLLKPVAAPRAVELVLIETHGDRDQASALSAMGGFGVFTKAIQNAILDGRVDVAVHSLKDLPTISEPLLELAAVPPRGPTGDAFISRKHRRFDELPEGATVGSSSLRRRAQVLNRRPDLKLLDLRGNVDTRLRKLDDQNLDAIILAEAGLARLGLVKQITEILDSSWMLPAVGQGAIGLECRASDEETKRLLGALRCPDAFARVQAERAMLHAARRRLPCANRHHHKDTLRRADGSRCGAVTGRRPACGRDAQRTGLRSASGRPRTGRDAPGRRCRRPLEVIDIPGFDFLKNLYKIALRL